jgi:omega-hydroxy-beta-dihydromenaquinone-9 sulfotransferase
LKSPPHTARIRLLLEMFPQARFVHIHRHPYDVFQSCRHFYDTATWYSYLQKPDMEKIDSRIIARYRQMYDAFFTERDLIPAGQFHEMSFTELEHAPATALRTLYEKLGIPAFETFQPTLLEYIKSLSGYRKNAFPPLPASLCKQLGDEWQPSFERWNYLP